jgi:hypothetical protein
LARHKPPRITVERRVILANNSSLRMSILPTSVEMSDCSHRRSRRGTAGSRKRLTTRNLRMSPYTPSRRLTAHGDMTRCK